MPLPKRKALEAEMARTGGSILLGRKIVSRAEELPPDEVLAKGDPGRQAEIRRDLQREMDALQARMRSMQSTASEGAGAASAGATQAAEAVPASDPAPAQSESPTEAEKEAMVHRAGRPARR